MGRSQEADLPISAHEPNRLRATWVFLVPAWRIERTGSDRLVTPVRGAALLVAQFAEDMVERPFQLLGGGAEGGLEGGRLVAHRDRLVVGDARLHQAALVAIAGLVAVGVVELHD